MATYQKRAPQYTLAGDLLVLATKALNSGNISSASRLFAHACQSTDLSDFVDNTLATAGKIGKTLPRASMRVIAALENQLENQGPMDEAELKFIVNQIKKHHASDYANAGVANCDLDENFDEEEELASSGEEEDEGSFGCTDEDDEVEELEDVCPDCDSDPCECEYETEGTQEEELSFSSVSPSQRDLLESVKTGLVGLKVRSNDWEVKQYVPILLNFFPNLALQGDMDSDIGMLVNKILNRLHSIDYKTLIRLNASLATVQEGSRH
jgi:hypothetical protein